MMTDREKAEFDRLREEFRKVTPQTTPPDDDNARFLAAVAIIGRRLDAIESVLRDMRASVHQGLRR